jgi:hypothetical protein
MSRQLLIIGSKTFRITIPDKAKVTFGPWSPSTGEGRYAQSEKALNGTLRVYETAKAGATILAVFSGVTSFRESTLEYEEQVAKEEGAILWKSDSKGYSREEKVQRTADWTTDPLLAAGEAEEPGADGDGF